MRNDRVGKGAWGGVLLLVATGAASPGFSQNSNLAYQVANLAEDVRILDEQVRSLRNELETVRRENGEMRQLVVAYEKRVDSSLNKFATIGMLNDAIERAVRQLEQRDETMQSEIVLQVQKQISDFANTIRKTIGGLPANTGPDPSERRDFHDNFPKTGTEYVVRSGDTLSGIASKFNSTVDWIVNANQISKPKYLQAGRNLFVPQEN